MEGFDFAEMSMQQYKGSTPTPIINAEQEQLPMEIIDQRTGEVIKL